MIDPRDIIRVRGRAHVHVADWLPAFVNAVRVLLAVGMISLFWIVSAWPNGVAAITFCAVIVILFRTREILPILVLMTFLGNRDQRAAAAVLVFAVLPSATTFPSLCLAPGLGLVPLENSGAFPGAIRFCSPRPPSILCECCDVTNGMNLTVSGFWNGAIAILAGIAVGAVAMRIIPPVSPEIRTQRLLSLTLEDFRRLARRVAPGRSKDWENKDVARLLAMPDQAEAQERAELAAMVDAVGKEIGAPSSHRAALCPRARWSTRRSPRSPKDGAAKRSPVLATSTAGSPPCPARDRGFC